MTSQNSRLPREEFRARGYKTINTPFFLLKAKKNNAESIRIGIVIGKVIYKEATKRNFWKRQAKAMLLKIVPKGMDILLVFISHKAVLTKKQFREDLEGAINKIT